jgi:hypothetical protein
MPILEKKEMSAREFKTLKRFNIALKSCKVLRDFFDKGFRSYEALKTIVQIYHPETDFNRLYDFWHFRNIDDDIAMMLEDVFEKLKQE